MVLFLLTAGCSHIQQEGPARLATVVLQDRNGFSETVSQRDRLARLEGQDFETQPAYRKVIRVYERRRDGAVPSIVTAYHPNGQIHHRLEAENGRALGRYQQWYPSGALKIEAQLVGGVADLNEAAMATWQMDGVSRVFFENGTLMAEMHYCKGALEGPARDYNSTGRLKRVRHFAAGAQEGDSQEWWENGEIAAKCPYRAGLRHGEAFCWNERGECLSQESWWEGRLVHALYPGWADQGWPVVLGIRAGTGWKPETTQEGRVNLVEIHDGQPNGQVKQIERGICLREWRQENGLKDGLEILYYPASPQPKLEMTWLEGSLTGPCQSYFPSGQPECRWEMVENRRHGKLVSWYRSGGVMLVEEYDQGRLMKGEYFEPGNPVPVSSVVQGAGTATLFQPDGRPLRSVEIQDGVAKTA